MGTPESEQVSFGEWREKSRKIQNMKYISSKVGPVREQRELTAHPSKRTEEARRGF